MGSSKGPDNVTQTTTSEPPAFIRPFINRALGAATGVFEQGPQQYYPGQTVVPFSPQTNQALNMQQQRATGGSPLVDTAQMATQRIAAGDTPLAQLLSPQMGPTGSTALGNLNPTIGPTGAAPLSPTARFGGLGDVGLARTARGDFLNSNPFLDQTFNRAAGAVNKSLDTVLARSGRDLTANLGERERQLSDLATGIYGGNFQAERGRQLQASGQLSGQGAGARSQLSRQQFGAGDSALGRQAAQQGQLASQIFSGGQNALNRQLQAASGLTGQQLSAASQAIPLSREDYFDIANLRDVGGAVESQAGNIIQDRLSRFNFAQQAPSQAVNQFISQVYGAPSGTNTSSSQPVFSNPTGNLLGGALTGAQLFGTGGALAGVGGLSAGGGAGIGALLGLLSDDRTKENKRRVGFTDNGIPIYTYNYIGDPVTRMGVMSSDVREKIPDAVYRHPDGYDRVFYDKVN